MRAGIEPGVATAHDLHVELLAFQVDAVHISDFQLTPRRGLEIAGDVEHLVVVEIEAGDGIVRLGGRRLFFETDGLARWVEFDHPVTLGIVHVVGEDRGAARLLSCRRQVVGKFVAVEDVVAENQGAVAAADEVTADDEGLSQPVRTRLDGVLQVQAPLAAIAEQLLEARRVLRRRDDQHIAYPCQHQRGQRVIDHRLVVDRQQLFGHGQGDRIQAGTGPTGEDDAFALRHAFAPYCLPTHCL